METNYSLLFYLKNPKNYTTGPIPIYMRITVNAPGKEFQLGANTALNDGAVNQTVRTVIKKAPSC